MERHGRPDWAGAVARAQAPQLPSLLPAAPPPPADEERFNTTHGYHGEFATSGNPQVTGQKATGQPNQKGPRGKQFTQSTQGNVQQQIAQLLAQAAQLEAQARNDLENAGTIKLQLQAVLNQLAYLTAPQTGSSAGTAAGASSVGSTITGSSTGTPTTGSAASGTPTSTTPGTTSGTTGNTSYADQITTLQGQASAYRAQISALENQAAQYNGQAASLRAQAAALGGPTTSNQAAPTKGLPGGAPK